MKRIHLLFVVLALATVVVLFRPYLGIVFNPVIHRMSGGKTVGDRLEQFGEAARARMRGDFVAAGVAYPPAVVTLLAIKEERKLMVYAGPASDSLRLALEYPVLGQSGELGPKLREGDRQVPEGLYRITGLNPNSQFHVSLRVNYPNDFDLEKAAAEGRTEPGSDIFIHGRSASVGCLAMGDPVAEELFTLVADVGKTNVQLILAPVDFRIETADRALPASPDWVPGLYAEIEGAIRQLPGAS